MDLKPNAKVKIKPVAMKTLIMLLLMLIGTMLRAQQLPRGSVSDIDGNDYKTVVIGKYEWMCENLKTTTYSDGTKIPMVTDSIQWKSLTEGTYCWYANNEGNAKSFGAMYNWYAVNTGLLCPRVWRVPSDEEWAVLEGCADTRYRRGDPEWKKSGGRGTDAGMRLKSASGWDSAGGGSDDFGFSALPGGERCSNGRFFVKGKSAFWWTSTEKDSGSAWYRNMIYGLGDVYRNTHPKWMGFSVRCLRDK